MTSDAKRASDPAPLPPVIVGGWQLSVGHRTAPRPRTDVLDDLVALVGDGFTTFDCADIYTGVERLFGELRRTVGTRLGREVAEGLRIHTKLVPDRSDLARVDRAYVRRIVERSARRLGVERLDLVQFSWWDYEVPGWVEVGLWLDELRTEGRIRDIGVTNFDVPRLREIVEAGVPVISNQVQYSALDHRPENGMTAFCRQRSIHLLAYGSLAGGFLSGRWVDAGDPGPDVTNRSLTKYRLIIDEFGGWEPYQELLHVLAGIADRRRASVAQVAIAYVLGRPGVASSIVGMSRADRLREARAASALELTTADVAAIRECAFAAPGPRGDCFGLERVPGGPHAAVMRYDLNKEPDGAGARR